MNVLSAVVVFTFVAVAICHGADENTFVSTSAGVSVTKPANWVFLEKSDQAGGTIAQLGRHPEPYPEMNATCRIRVLTATEARGQSPRELAQAQIARMTKNFPDYKVVDGPKEVVCAGKKGIGFSAHYTLIYEGKPHKVFWKMIFIPHGAGSLSVTMACPQDQAPKFAADYDAILKSLKVQ